MKTLTRVLIVAVALAAFGSASMSGQGPSTGLTADALKVLTFRNLGPTLNNGRVVDVEIDPKNPNVWYVASAFGGVWKTVNRGITFDPIFGAYHFTTCCVVVDPKDSNVVWVGSGENNSQRSAHFGDGVYKSTDGGKTFKNMGLQTSEHIGKIVVDPRNSNTVWVASQGPLFSEGGERGLYKTTDGGATWTASLTISKDTGISDIAFDPSNPDIIYAGSYQRRRHVGQMVGGGPEGGIWKTMNGGKNWTKLSAGLPKGDVGRVALAIDPKGTVTEAVEAKDGKKAVPAKRGTVVYAIVHAKADERGFYKSVDGGLNWTKMSNYVGGGAAYYCELFVDPFRPDTIWSANTPLDWSRDGGKTFTPVPNMSSV
ncbi:MAG: glycosyl hydrolase, partial [Lysobacteraceae bacterium]